MEPDETEAEVTELLENFVPNLLSEKRYEGFLVNLFASERGKWLNVAELCRGMDGCADFFSRLAALVTRKLLVVWLDHPGLEGEYGYVHFYLEDYFWTKSALYNLRMVAKSQPTS